MRNISFQFTQAQFRNRTKTVTRRMGWRNLKAGDRLRAVEKGMGLKKGEKIKALGVIEVVSVRQECLGRMTDDVEYGMSETLLEGFDKDHQLTWPSRFVEFFCATHKGCKPESEVTRIEFKYVD